MERADARGTNAEDGGPTTPGRQEVTGCRKNCALYGGPRQSPSQGGGATPKTGILPCFELGIRYLPYSQLGRTIASMSCFGSSIRSHCWRFHSSYKSSTLCLISTPWVGPAGMGRRMSFAGRLNGASSASFPCRPSSPLEALAQLVQVGRSQRHADHGRAAGSRAGAGSRHGRFWRASVASRVRVASASGPALRPVAR